MRSHYFISILICTILCSNLQADWKQIGLEGIEVTAIDVGWQVSIGTNGQGVYWYNDTNDLLFPLKSVLLDSFELYIRTVHSIYSYRGDYIIFAGSDSGLISYVPSSSVPQWTRITDIPSEPVTAITGYGDTLFATTQREVYRSEDAGQTWKALNADSVLPSGQNVPDFTSLAVNTINPAQVFAGSKFFGAWSSWMGVLQSSDMGETWQIHNEGLVSPVMEVLSLCFFNNGIGINTDIYACGTDDGVYYYTPLLSGWQELKPGLLDTKKIYDLHVTTYSNSDIPELFACSDIGAYLLSGYPQTSFENAEWKWLDFTKKTFCASSRPQTGNYVKFWYVGTEDGLYKYFRDEADIHENNSYSNAKTPGIDIRSDNYNIIINSISENNTINRISLLDSKGRVLHSERFGGEHTVSFSKEGIIHGTYILSIETNNGIVRRKLTVFK